MADTIDQAPARRASTPAVIGWAAYLACSWTWCIGMFLPVLLVRDYGLWGFIVFAVPNVLGAAAMGWVVGSPERSRQLTGLHREACRCFSAVTVAFQLFFFFSVMHEVLGAGAAPVRVLLVGLAAVPALAALRMPTTASVLTWCLSAAMLVMAAMVNDVWLPVRPERPAENLALLAPVCAFGFLLCPYLDLTFHRARQALPGMAGGAAFALGFGVLFLAMILGTLAYMPAALSVLRGTWDASDSLGYSVMVGGHVIVQLLFTVALHTREAARVHVRRPPFLPVVLGLVVVSMLALVVAGPLAKIGDLTVWEVVYRTFMAFYGLLFPAYVWLCMIPTRDGHAGIVGERGRRKLVVLLAAIVLAAPCYWMGFIARDVIWLAPGLGVVLLARLAVRGGRGGDVAGAAA